MSTATLPRTAQAAAEPPGCPVWCDATHNPTADRGEVYHIGALTPVPVRSAYGDARCDASIDVFIDQCDDPGEPGEPTIGLLVGMDGGLSLTTGQALNLAAVLLGHAFRMAAAELSVPAQDVRLGDEIHTPEGWQVVTGLIHDGKRAEVAIYTVHDEDPAARYDLAERVLVRREVTL
jgi:hypothetical protein